MTENGDIREAIGFIKGRLESLVNSIEKIEKENIDHPNNNYEERIKELENFKSKLNKMYNSTIKWLLRLLFSMISVIVVSLLKQLVENNNLSIQYFNYLLSIVKLFQQ